MTFAPLGTLRDILAFEAELPFEARCPHRGVYDLFQSSAEKHPERTAITMLMTGAPDEQPRQVTYRELLGLIRRAANAFSSLSGRSQRPGVAFLLPSLVETHLVLWGAETAGFVVPINFLLNAEHITELVRASGASILVALGPHPQLNIWQKALQVKEALPEIVLMRVAPPDAPAAAGVVDFGAALRSQPDDRLVFGEPGRDHEVAAYFHTGGTTGAPKLVAHTHHNQLVAAFGAAALLGVDERDVLTNGFPLFHVAGTICCGLSCFLVGMNVLILSPSGFRNPAMIRSFWRIVERYRATLAGGVPTAVGALVEVPIDADISRVRAGICGGASIPRAVAERFEQVTGKRLYEVLGMTEAAGVISVDPTCGERTLSSVGYRIPYTEIAIRRLNSDGTLGEVCAPNEVGVLTVKGPTVSPGYKDQAQNAGVFDGATLNTGDLAFVDELGKLHIAGRAKDLIIRGGHNIDPMMIEEVMTSHPAVALAAAVSQPDAYAGELPVCYLSLRPDMQVTLDVLMEHARAAIAERPAWPKHLYIVDALPMTNVGKIYKPALRLDATKRLVQALLSEHGIEEASVSVVDGGPRGQRVTVTLAASTPQRAAEKARDLLAPYVFESVVAVGA